MKREHGPFQVIENDGSGSVDSPIEAPRRRYACSNYSICLNLAASLNWDNFTCRGCSGNVDEPLLWRARIAQKKNRVTEKIFSASETRVHEISTQTKVTQQIGSPASTQTQDFQSSVIPLFGKSS